MRSEDLRKCTKKAAIKSKKRMAQVVAVYTILLHKCSPEPIIKVEKEGDITSHKWH